MSRKGSCCALVSLTPSTTSEYSSSLDALNKPDNQAQQNAKDDKHNRVIHTP